jgi:hypothetical protein
MPRPAACIVTQVLDDLTLTKYPRCHPTTVMFVTRGAIAHANVFKRGQNVL